MLAFEEKELTLHVVNRKYSTVKLLKSATKFQSRFLYILF